jgi:L-alanine-DL-glutamate epimerase-like enolase superfamily enzyme
MSDVRIDSLKVSAFTIPTETPESDGTLEWNSTTIVVVELAAGGATGLGYTYSDSATAHLINRKLGPLLVGSDPLDIESLWLNLRVQTRNLGWFEEPVTSDNLEGLHFLREKLPASIEVAAGEYGYDLAHFHDLLRAGAVDVLQADVTRCRGITGFMKVSALAEAYKIPISSHCAPTLHLHPACSVPNFRHAEYFYDHCLIEAKLFDGVPAPMNGTLQPDLSRPGFGIELKRKDAEKFSF